MSDVKREIEGLIRRFVDDLQAVVRQAAINSVAAALATDATTPSRRRKPKTTVAPSRKFVKRSQEEVLRVVNAVARYVAAHPGQGIEDIAKGMKTTTSPLTRPISKLLAAKAIRKTGVKRATKYYPPKAAAPRATTKKTKPPTKPGRTKSAQSPKGAATQAAA